MNSQPVTHRAVAGPTAKPSFRQLLWRWLVDDFDYRYVIEHHSLRPLYHPMRAILAGNTALLAICAMFLLQRGGPDNDGRRGVDRVRRPARGHHDHPVCP